MNRRKSYFEKRLLLREENLFRKRDFYEEKKILLGTEFLFQENPILKRGFYEEKIILFWQERWDIGSRMQQIWGWPVRSCRYIAMYISPKEKIKFKKIEKFVEDQKTKKNSETPREIKKSQEDQKKKKNLIFLEKIEKYAEDKKKTIFWDSWGNRGNREMLRGPKKNNFPGVLGRGGGPESQEIQKIMFYFIFFVLCKFLYFLQKF